MSRPFDSDLVRQHQSLIQQWLGGPDRAASLMDHITSSGVYRSESPIEAVFALWFEALAEFKRAATYQIGLAYQHEVLCAGRSYRLDFALVPDHPVVAAYARSVGSYPLPIAIELDGHAFHERTKPQVISRDQRDRDLQGAGWRVFHISGSELVQSPPAVVGEVMEAGAPLVQSLIDSAVLHFTKG